jgi:hypothetical protein
VPPMVKCHCGIFSAKSTGEMSGNGIEANILFHSQRSGLSQA